VKNQIFSYIQASTVCEKIHSIAVLPNGLSDGRPIEPENFSWLLLRH